MTRPRRADSDRCALGNVRSLGVQLAPPIFPGDFACPARPLHGNGAFPDFWLFVHLFLGASAVTPALAQQPNSGVDRLYVLECGHGTAPDQGRFSPGYNDGKPFDLVDNCYLIHHAQGYLLWGTALPHTFFKSPARFPTLSGLSNRHPTTTP